MIYDGTVAADSPRTRTGGVPLVPPGFEWPRCAECGLAMQFGARIRSVDVPGSAAPEHDVLLFQCADAGTCDTYKPESGANQVLVVNADADLEPAIPPTDVDTTLGEVSAVVGVEFDAEDYLQAYNGWLEATGRSHWLVLGQLGGSPFWWQQEDHPDCPAGHRMDFVAQLEEGGTLETHSTGMNFAGSGTGYLFACVEHGEGRFTWQR